VTDEDWDRVWNGYCHWLRISENPADRETAQKFEHWMMWRKRYESSLLETPTEMPY
jgi:hypothetical protein